MQQSLILLGIVILVGIIGNLLFAKTRIPESLFLIITGLLIGPIFNLVDRSFFLSNMSFFVTIAMVFVLLNAGLNLDLYRTLKNAGYAIVFTILVFLGTIATVAFTTVYFFDWPIMHGIFLGIVGSGTTTVTITHLVEKLKTNRESIDSDTKNLLVIESVVNDLTVILGASIVLALSEAQVVTGQHILQLLFNELLVSVLAGIILGIGWIFLYVYHLHGNKLSYIFTIGLALVIYAIAGYLNLNGAITVMLFSLIIGNHQVIIDKFRVRTKLFKGIDRDVFSMKKIDVEFTFLVRTFFFFLLGIIFDPAVLEEGWVIYLALGVLVAELVARYIGCVLMSFAHESFKKARFIRTTMVASGVTSTLVSFLSIEAGIDIPHLAEIVLLLVFLTTGVAIIGTSVQEYRTNKLADAKTG